jgi:signal transduction histidine kinase/ActR/RegA family two-component response regulator
MDELLNIAPGGFLRFTDKGTILLANLTLANSLGYEPEALHGKSIDCILPVASRIFYQTHLFPLLKLSGEVNEVYLSLRSQKGAEVPVLLNAVRREGSGGAVNDCILIPIRQRNQYEGEILRAKSVAEEASRAKDEFLALVSHELRTPLNAILGWAQIVRSEDLDADLMRSALETIERNAKAQAHLIEDILDFSRIISGKLRLEISQVDPAQVLVAALDVVRPGAEAKCIRLQPLVSPDAGLVSGDPHRLQQVLWNLLSNAVKFTPEGGQVQVRLERINSHVEITVTDTGQGIAPEFLPYVFDRFRQEDSSSTKRHGGLGLGLAISRQIVELHGGTIRVHSDGDGKGTTFTVELPIAILHPPNTGTSAPAADKNTSRSRHTAPEPTTKADFQVEQPTGVTTPSLAGLHVLVVEDDQDSRELLWTVLTHRGAQVTAVGNARQALEEIQQSRPDFLISDIEMPGEDGYDLIRRVRALGEHQGGLTPAIAVTAQARSTDRMRALGAGFQTHLAKPIIADELVSLLAKLSHQGR